MDTQRSVAFGTLLRRHRIAAGLTQEELAERAGISRRSLGDMERGAPHTPRKETVALLVQALDLSASERRAVLEAARRPGAATAPLPVPASPAAPPFVGRTRELDLLERHLADEGPPVLLLAGEPGIGKTRLLHAALPRAIAHGLRVLGGGCQRRGGQEPYAPLLDALRRYLRSRRPHQLRLELQGCAWLVRLLPELADGPIPPVPSWTLTAEHERRLMGDAVVRFLGNVAGPAGTLLVLDDLQWASPDALDLLSMLAHAAPEVPLRVLGAYRDTEVTAEDPLTTVLTDLAHAQLLTRRLLEPLATAEAAHLLAAALDGVKGAHAERQARIVQRAGGVPFFVLSCAQTLRLELSEGRVDVAEAQVPWDVAQSARQRVAMLSPAAREVLGVAALVGRVARPNLLAAVTGRTELEVLAALTAAERARILALDGHVYRFAHDVVREVIEDDVGAGPRRLLHRRIADVLRDEAGDDLVEEIAYHYARSDATRAAAEWLERAGDRAVATLAHRAALAHYQAAWQRRNAEGSIPQARRADALADLAEKLADVSASLYQYPAARDYLAQARTRASSPLRRAVLWYKEGMTYRWEWAFVPALGAFAAAEEEGRSAVGETTLPARLRAAIALGRAEIHRLQGHRAARDAAVEEALRLFDVGDADEQPLEEVLRLHGATSDTGALAPLAHAVVLRGIGLAERDEVAQAEEHFRQGLSLYDAAGDVRGAAITLWYLAALADELGYLNVAEEQCRRSLQSFERCGGQYGAAACWHLLSTLAWQRGAFVQAEECAQRSLVIDEQMGNHARAITTWYNLSQVALLRGRLTQAEAYVRRRLALSDRWTVAHARAAASLDLGLLACERGALHEAAQQCRAARRAARHLDNSPLEAEAALTLARTLLRAERLDAAVTALDYGTRLAGRRPWSRVALQGALLAGEIHLRRGALPTAETATEEALRVASGQRRRPDEAVAYRVLGQIALARGDAVGADAMLRNALARQADMGAALEAARSRLALARALAAHTDGALIPHEARALLAEAQAQFAASGAAWDLAEADHVAATWPQGHAEEEAAMTNHRPCDPGEFNGTTRTQC